MLRRFLPAILIASLSAGCVPVTEPVGDITKAEPDKELVGTWLPAKGKKPEMNKIKIELAPEVKGNPKGVMAMTFLGFPFPEGGGRYFFFLTTVGKERYGNLLLDTNDKLRAARLDKEGEHDKWSKGAGRCFVVFRCAATKDGLTLNFGDEDAFPALMKDEKIARSDRNIGPDDQKVFAFKTPEGWLAKYLEKNGRDKVFPAAKDLQYVREK